MTRVVPDKELVSRLEELCRVKLSDEERRRLLSELPVLLRYVDEVFEVDVEGFEPLLHFKPLTELREDVPELEMSPHLHLSGALTEGEFVKGPRV